MKKGLVSRRSVCLFAGISVLVCCAPHDAAAFGIFGNTDASNPLRFGARWNAASRLNPQGQERSLDGGLRYSVSGGSYQAFRDSFVWDGGAPDLAEFQGAVENAFAAWTKTDPVTGLSTAIYFTPDLGTPVVDQNIMLGAEIDLIARDLGNPSLAGSTNVSWGNIQDITLTSGATFRAQPINGSDVRINSNSGAAWNLPFFQLLLTHELGHALGLKDVDTVAGPAGDFLDDNFDGTSSATALATLANSFASLIDPLNPAASPLSAFTVNNGNPGFDTSGVIILMESSIPPALIGNLSPLSNDDYAGRQFLYPTVPEPSAVWLMAIASGIAAVAGARRKRHGTRPAK